MRLPLISAFSRNLEADYPSGTRSLNKSAVMNYTGELYLIDAELSYKRAELFGKLASSLTSTQKKQIAELKFGDSSSWPNVNERDVIDKRKYSQEVNVAIFTLASEFFSYYAGNSEADVYFCPERHATYFGSFYLKDMPAVYNRNYNISTSLTGDSGAEFLQILNSSQRKKITSLVSQQKKALTEIVSIRRQVSAELRKFLKGGKADRNKVRSLSRCYGELDGEISYYYVTAFSDVAQSLTQAQKTKLKKLRNLDKYTMDSGKIFIYAELINKPSISNTNQCW
jgi:hypothetical protein